MHRPQIYPSLMSADLMNLASVVDLLEPHCDGFHVDIMDNHFVPNLTWGAHLTNQLANRAVKPLLVHLMVTDPLSIINKLKLTHGSVISFHCEAVKDKAAIIERITTLGYTPSVALKPSTPLETVVPYLEHGIDHVLLMSVEPGFSGQKFIEHSHVRLKELVALKEVINPKMIICMDGGITKENIRTLSHNGAHQFAISSAIFDQPNMLEALKELYTKAD